MRAKPLKSAGHPQDKVAQNGMLKSNIYLFAGAQKPKMKDTNFTFWTQQDKFAIQESVFLEDTY